MTKRKHLTAAEADVLDAVLPPGLTYDMRDVACCLFEAMVLRDDRAGSAKPDPHWRVVLKAMARMSIIQLQHLAQEKGGKAIYLAKGVVAHLTARDLEMCAKFRGNYDVLAKEYNLTPMRVRQIVDAYQQEQFALRQGRLPGIDIEN